jgi:hypothetical protein
MIYSATCFFNTIFEIVYSFLSFILSPIISFISIFFNIFYCCLKFSLNCICNFYGVLFSRFCSFFRSIFNIVPLLFGYFFCCFGKLLDFFSLAWIKHIVIQFFGGLFNILDSFSIKFGSFLLGICICIFECMRNTFCKVFYIIPAFSNVLSNIYKSID